MLKDLNDLARAIHQAGYDYALDRWGLYVGTFRCLIIAFANVDVIVTALIRAGTGTDGGLLRAIIDVVLQAGLMWFFFGRHHLGREWSEQDSGKLNALNARAMGWQSAGTIIRIIIIALTPILWTWVNPPDNIGLRIAAILGFVMWTYSCEVMVRERDPDRFKRLAPQAT